MYKVLVNGVITLALLGAAVVLALLPWSLLLVLAVLFALWSALSHRGRQAWAVTRVGLATLPQRLGSSSVVVIGIAGVVGVLVALLAMGEGFRATLVQTGSDDTVLVMRAGANAELNSVLVRDAVVQIEQTPGILKNAKGEPIASPELVVVASLPRKGSGLDANLQIRGVGPQVRELRPHVHITAGRDFQPGLRELVVGKGAAEQFQGLDLGATITLNNQVWTVVGSFEAGDAFDSEVWADADIVASTYRRGNSVTDVTVRLVNADALDAFKAALAANPQLKVDAETTRSYFSRQSENLTLLIRIVGSVVGAIMAIGAIFGALNTMYAAVATRAREIATLRAIGFRGLPVIVSVMIETMLLALVGGLLGAAIAWLIFDNYSVSTMSQNFSQVVFAFRVSPALALEGLKWALVIGFIGGLFPALRAARLPVTTALREL
ncbi:MAG: ABC transporter permease [Xanthomonadales bacterium]|nr:ABC transporter permease [Xanthomonadales bacterium]MDL1869534.1 ABC transporter permease [Gammaproteobacteria bacterium PRO6]